MRHAAVSLAAAGLLLNAAACASAPRVDPPTGAVAPGTSVLDLTPPARIGQYTRGERHDFGMRSAGISYTYTNGGPLRLTAFFYERVPERRGASADEALAIQVASFRTTLEYERSRGMYEDFTSGVDRADTVTVDGRPLPGHVVTFGLKQRGQWTRSSLHLHAVGDGFIKVRATAPAQGWDALDIDGFVHSLIRSAISGR